MPSVTGQTVFQHHAVAHVEIDKFRVAPADALHIGLDGEPEPGEKFLPDESFFCDEINQIHSCQPLNENFGCDLFQPGLPIIIGQELYSSSIRDLQHQKQSETVLKKILEQHMRFFIGRKKVER